MGSRRSQHFTSEGKVEKADRKGTVHPIWRGVGIFMMVLVPAMGFGGALLVLDANSHNSWFRIPNQLLVPGTDHLLLVKGILTIIIGAIIYFLLMMLTFIIYRIFGPPRLGPQDAPPVQWKSQDKS